MPQTIEQMRAAHAFKQVQNIPQGEFDKHRTESKKLPTRVLNSGLGQAIAFLKAKNIAAQLVTALDSWAQDQLPGDDGGSRNLLGKIMANDSDYLRRATDEIMAYMQWYVRFIEARANRER